MTAEQSDIRNRMRRTRRSLSAREQSVAAEALAASIARHPLFLRSARIAFYWPSDGEIDPTIAMQEALARGKHCFLPVLYRGGTNRLLFGRCDGRSRLVRNRFGIPEPDLTRCGWRYANQLDLVFTPLVAFDRSGNRIGMGGGFYDSSLQRLRCRPNWRRPYVSGLAHDFQCIAEIAPNDWDIPLEAAITDRQSYQFKRRGENG